MCMKNEYGYKILFNLNACQKGTRNLALFLSGLDLSLNDEEIFFSVLFVRSTGRGYGVIKSHHRHVRKYAGRKRIRIGVRVGRKRICRLRVGRRRLRVRLGRKMKRVKIRLGRKRLVRRVVRVKYGRKRRRFRVSFLVLSLEGTLMLSICITPHRNIPILSIPFVYDSTF